MSSTTTARSMLYCIPAVMLLTGQAFARHSHHHHIRQIAVAVPIVSADPTPTTTIQATRVAGEASSEVISDIQDIKEGIDDLPGNLLSYIQSVEQRLETVEELLQSLLSNATPTPIAKLPSVPAISTTSIRAGPAPFTASEGPALSTQSPAAVESSSVPNTYTTSRITSTRTSGATVTRHMPLPVLSTGTSPRPFGYAPLGNGTIAAAPTAGTSKSTGTKVLTLTVAVIPAPTTITLPGLTGGSVPTTFATLVVTA